MGLLRLQHVSRVVLLCVIMLRGYYVADAEQTAGPFFDMMDDFVFCSMYYRSWYVNRSEGPSQRCLHSEPIRFKENATGPVISFSTKFIALIGLGLPLPSQLGYGLFSRTVLEGFTFALLPHPNVSLGSNGGYLGLLNATSNGDPNSHTFAVEFDLVKSPQFSDPDGGFHIGIDINSMNSRQLVLFSDPDGGFHIGTDIKSMNSSQWVSFSDPDGGFHIGTDINSMNSRQWVLLVQLDLD